MRADKMPGSVLPAEGDFSCAAVVVAGGASRRLNHVPKASLSDGLCSEGGGRRIPTRGGGP